MSKKEPIPTQLEYSHAEVLRAKSYGQCTPSGVVFDGELAGPNGMSFVLLREEHTSDEMLSKSVDYLRRERDVVGKIKVTDIIKPQVERERG
jgi:hypothetical protein